MTKFSPKIYNFCWFLMTSAKNKKRYKISFLVFKSTYKGLLPCKVSAPLPFLYQKLALGVTFTPPPLPRIHQTSVLLQNPLFGILNSFPQKHVWFCSLPYLTLWEHLSIIVFYSPQYLSNIYPLHLSIEYLSIQSTIQFFPLFFLQYHQYNCQYKYFLYSYQNKLDCAGAQI